MNERELTTRLEQAIPEVPMVFHNAMLGAFAQMQEQETQERKVAELPRRGLKKRAAAIILIAALLMATMGVAAALNPSILTIFWGQDVTVEESFPERVRQDVLEETIGDVRVRIEEAVYDGVALYVTYSVRNMTVDRMLGVSYPEDPPGFRLLTEEDLREIAAWEAGDWHDGLWINGQDTEMPDTDVQEVGGDEPGEYVVSNKYNLNTLGITLSGQTRIALPIGKRQHWDYETYQTLPRDENGRALEPEEGCLVFYIDAELPGVERVADGPVSVWPDGTEIWLDEAVFTPVKLYVTLNYRVPDALIEAYKEKMGGDGYYSAEGELIYPYGAIDVVTDWVYDLALVDENGCLADVQPNGRDGYNGSGDTVCYYIFPYMTEYPSPLYAAPLVNGVPNMDCKVLIRE